MPEASGHAGSIVLLTGSVLCHNPRVIKEADTLARAGYRVEVLGAWLADDLAERDRALMSTRPWTFTPVVSASPVSTWARARFKLGRALGSTMNFETGWQLGYVAPELLRVALTRSADLFIAHSEQGIWTAARLAARGRRVGVDMEDWFSEDLPPQSRRGRPVRLLRQLESQLLTHGAHSSATSEAMSNALADAYKCATPTVVYNCFPWADRQQLDDRRVDRTATESTPSIHWYSQTLGGSRGLEDLVAALPMLSVPAHIHLRGADLSGYRERLLATVPESWQPRVHFHDVVANDVLLSRIAEHDIGFAGEMSDIPSRNLTVTNKVFQYLLAGLAVVATDTDGQREIAARAGRAIRVYASGDPRSLASVLNRLLEDDEALRTAKADALLAAEREYCWERQESALLESIERAVQDRRFARGA